MDIPYGLVVRISGFHPDGPGSIPGVGTPHPFFFQLCHAIIMVSLLLPFNVLPLDRGPSG